MPWSMQLLFWHLYCMLKSPSNVDFLLLSLDSLLSFFSKHLISEISANMKQLLLLSSQTIE